MFSSPLTLLGNLFLRGWERRKVLRLTRRIGLCKTFQIFGKRLYSVGRYTTNAIFCVVRSVFNNIHSTLLGKRPFGQVTCS